MFALKRMLAFGGLTGLLGALAFAAPAGASLKAECVVDGDVKAHTTKPSFKKYVQLMGGHGTYTFDSISVVCVDTGPSKGVGGGAVHTGSVDASGTFKHRIKNKPPFMPAELDVPCGLGKVAGIITGQTMHPKFNAIVGDKFAIQFGPVLGHGEFFWHAAAPAGKVPDKPPTLPKLWDAAGPEKPGPVAKPYRYAGDVQLALPGPLGAKELAEELAKRLPPADKCTKAFHVNGAIFVHEA